MKNVLSSRGPKASHASVDHVCSLARCGCVADAARRVDTMPLPLPAASTAGTSATPPYATSPLRVFATSDIDHNGAVDSARMAVTTLAATPVAWSRGVSPTRGRELAALADGSEELDFALRRSEELVRCFSEDFPDGVSPDRRDAEGHWKVRSPGVPVINALTSSASIAPAAWGEPDSGTVVLPESFLHTVMEMFRRLGAAEDFEKPHGRTPKLKLPLDALGAFSFASDSASMSRRSDCASSAASTRPPTSCASVARGSKRHTSQDAETPARLELSSLPLAASASMPALQVCTSLPRFSVATPVGATACLRPQAAAQRAAADAQRAVGGAAASALASTALRPLSTVAMCLPQRPRASTWEGGVVASPVVAFMGTPHVATRLVQTTVTSTSVLYHVLHSS